SDIQPTEGQPSSIVSAAMPGRSLVPASAAARWSADAIRRFWGKYGPHIVVLAAIATIANFLFFETFGLYEGDWAYFVKPYSTRESLSGLWQAMYTFRTGRPLQLFFVNIFALLGTITGSLAFVYVVAAAMFCTSVVLMYAALRHRFPAFFSLLA